MHFDSDLHSLSLSTVLLVAVVLWFLRSSFSRNFTYHYTGLEIGLVLFVIAGFIGIVVTSNKRAAINDFVSLLIPILMAVMLVQILNSHDKIRLILLVIVGIGVASAVQCAGQFFVDTQMMIDQYEADPHSILDPLGIAPGSFNQMLFEHRLYTRGINGFLTTSNSVGSFSILASFAAIALFAEHLRKYIHQKRNIWSVAATGIAAIVVLFNLAITRSKGAITAFLLALIIFILLISLGRWIAAHRKITFIICLILAIAAGFLVVSYGQSHGRLPGGNSMLVRWQYWEGAAKMYADHLLTGIGPGNFNSYYTQYKAPAALEVVKDPHNFILSLLTQYGPIGLIGFILMLLLTWYKTLKTIAPRQPAQKASQLLSRRTLLIFSTVLIMVLLFIRPLVKPLITNGEPASAVLYVMLTIYLIPVVIFAVGLWLASGILKEDRLEVTNLTAATIIAASVGVVAHNLIDFAIFEMGIYTTLWLILAALIALYNLRQPEIKVFNINLVARAAVIILFGVVVVAFFVYSFLPVARRTSKTAKAYEAYEVAFFDETQYYLTAAAEADKLNPIPLTMKGRLALREYHDYVVPRKDRLILAEQSYLAAIHRDRVNFQNYERLTEIYELLAETDKANKTEWLNKALDTSKQTVKLYPGLGRLRFHLAQIAEQLGDSTLALESYEKALDIEDAYRKQFAVMYPGREIFSRLGRENYDFAKQRVAALKSASSDD
jgi:O-antigen ligase